MLYIRGNPLDYDAWRDAYGCPGWSYLDVLPYFRRAEDQQRGESRFHGTGGPLRVEDQRYEHPLSRAWLEAAVASGLPRNEDFNGARQDGVGHYQMTQRDVRRWSVADAYLRPAMQRPNLTVETNAHVTQVIIEGDRATGVRYVRDGATREASATGEVVVASADPAAKPIVDPAYFTDETDLEVLVAGVRMAREIAAREPLADITAGEVAPGEDLDDDERVRDWVRATAGTMFHPTGTCAMGGSAEAVCDPELRARGVEGLRVVDASVMPATPRGNTNAPTIAVAERAADLIRGDTPLSPAALERELV